MKISRAIQMANLMEPGNTLPQELAILLLSELDGMIQSDIMLLAPEEIVSYDDAEQELMLRPPHDSLYVHYLVMMIRQFQQEFEAYNNAQTAVQEKLEHFGEWYVSHYNPARNLDRRYLGAGAAGGFGFAYLSAYGTAVKLGFTGSEAQWLASLKGDKGEPALMRYDAETGYLQWQVQGESEWYDLMEMATVLDAAAAAATSRAEAAAELALRGAGEAVNGANIAAAAADRAEQAAERAEAAAELAETLGVSEEYLQEQLAALKEDILYEPITITGISVSPSVAMIGSSIENPTVSWSVSREPAAQTVGGVEVGTDAREYTVEGSFSADAPGGSQSIAVRVTDEREAVATKSAVMHFHNAVYYSIAWGGGMPEDADLQGMAYKLQNSLGLTVNADCGTGEYILYAAPTRLGTPEFWANGFQGGFEKLGTMEHTNAAGYQESYDAWISSSDEVAGVTITVK